MTSTPRTLADLVEARSLTASTFMTFRGLVRTRPAKGYVSLYFGAGIPTIATLAGGGQFDWSFRAVCVGFDDNQCLFVLEQFRGLFQRWRPLSDRSASWFTEAPDDPPLLKDDQDPSDIRYSITPRFRITT